LALAVAGEGLLHFAIPESRRISDALMRKLLRNCAPASRRPHRELGPEPRQSAKDLQR